MDNTPLAVANNSGRVAEDSSELGVQHSNSSLVVVDSSASGDDHDALRHDVHNHCLSIHDRHHQRIIELNIELQRRLIGLKKITFSLGSS